MPVLQPRRDSHNRLLPEPCRVPPILLDVPAVPIVIELPQETVGAQDTALPAVLSARFTVMHDRNQPARYSEHLAQIRQDRCRWYDRQGCHARESWSPNEPPETRQELTSRTTLQPFPTVPVLLTVPIWLTLPNTLTSSGSSTRLGNVSISKKASAN